MLADDLVIARCRSAASMTARERRRLGRDLASRLVLAAMEARYVDVERLARELRRLALPLREAA